MSKDDVFDKIKVDATRLQVVPQLEGFSSVIATIQPDKRQGSLHLVVLDVRSKEVRIKTYSRSAIEEASNDDLREETAITDANTRQVVLVSSNSLDALRKAYPSYFLDTQEFIKTLNEIIALPFNTIATA